MAAVPRPSGGAGAFHPVAVENRAGASPFIVLCDHASNFVPAEYDALGLSAVALQAHIAWDPGALGVSRRLARELDAPLVRATVSRLVIDCNRPLDAPDLIAATSETTAIPGNATLSDAERQRRIASVHAPYHAAIESLLEERLAASRAVSLVAVHSFTPVYRGMSRPWEIGVIFDKDRRMADRLIEALKVEGLRVGVNEPYSPADRVYYTLTRHAEARAHGAAMIEIRNDLIRSPEEQVRWAERIAAALAPSVADLKESEVAPMRRERA